jgi:hydroxymethylpyrimidine pyrophosphatase-like HAD family hydrolase
METVASSLGLTADQPLPLAFREEETFYTRYDWCLNPILTLRDLFRRLREELDRAPTLGAPWQRAESRINLYLFTCAIACTADDYLCRPIGDLTPVATHFPRLRFLVNLGQGVLDTAQALRSGVADRRVARWRREWQQCVDHASSLLVRQAEPGERRWMELDARIRELAGSALPSRLLRRRMTVPAAFRNQDLAHHDLGVLARRLLTRPPPAGKPLVVVGLRTAGAYLAPLIKAYLTASGVPVAAWLTIRPKGRLSSRERRQLRRVGASGSPVVVVDEPPNSGDTLKLTIGILEGAGVAEDRITIAVPRNPAKADWTLKGRRVVTLDPPDYHKRSRLDPGAIAPLFREYFGPNARLPQNAAVEELNRALEAHHREGFHVRLKRVYEVRTIRRGADPITTFVIAKSVGWGWLGYHAYIAGIRLAGVVPPVIGMRDGLLFTKWIGELTPPEARRIPDVSVHALASYVASRARRLRLTEDPCYENLHYGRTGWSELVNLLRRAYGLYVGRLKIPALHKRLRRLITPVPALIDGRVKPDEWVAAGPGTGVLKADFEHHSFGKTELNVADPAYDLACATFNFGLEPEPERRLVQEYARQSGDRLVEDRVLLYQLLHGSLAMATAVDRAARDPAGTRHDWNRRYLGARAFLTSRLARFAAGRIPAPARVAWTKRLFFLDLDGVFDSEALGFPHTTPSGLAALELLRAHGVSVVVHTGRSIEEVHNYCRDYSLPGGVGELGSVFLDAVAGREIPLVNDQALDQLGRCREALARLPGVFVDPTYRYAVRAYRIVQERTLPPPVEQVEQVVREAGLDLLSVSPSSVDVIVLARGVDKGRGLTAARDYLRCLDQPVAAIGDSDRDIPMLEAADLAFAPSGCSAGVRALGDRGRCHITRAPMQRGLLRAAREMARLGPETAATPMREAPAPSTPGAELIESLLSAAERPRLRQFLGALAWWGL